MAATGIDPWRRLRHYRRKLQWIRDYLLDSEQVLSQVIKAYTDDPRAGWTLESILTDFMDRKNKWRRVSLKTISDVTLLPLGPRQPPPRLLAETRLYGSMIGAFQKYLKELPPVPPRSYTLPERVEINIIMNRTDLRELGITAHQWISPEDSLDDSLNNSEAAPILLLDVYPFSHHRCFNTDDEEVKSLLLTSPEAPHLYRCFNTDTNGNLKDMGLKLAPESQTWLRDYLRVIIPLPIEIKFRFEQSMLLQIRTAPVELEWVTPLDYETQITTHHVELRPLPTSNSKPQ